MERIEQDRRALERAPRSSLGWGPLLRWFLRAFFEPVHFPPEAEAELKELARRGTVIYVMRSAGILNYLYFNWAYARRGLPLVDAVVGVSTRLYRPLRALFSSEGEGPEAVARAAERGAASIVFLRRPAVLRSQGALADDPFPLLVEAQRRSRRPIFLVPQLLVFKRAPVKVRPGVADVILGSAEVPGRIHAFVSFLFNRKRSFVKIGKPIDLAKVLEAEAAAGTPDAAIARKVRGSLAVGLGRELRGVVGPPLKAAERFLEEILRDRALHEELPKLAVATGKTEAQVNRELRRCLREIAARYSPGFLDGANTVARWVFNRLYERVIVDEEGLRHAADAARRAPLILCPTHRSHVDYLLVSHVLYERGMTPPLVAAGANLSFWPLGPIFRRGGAFFIRRSFKGDRIYGAALSAYVRRLARDGYTQEFYPEGGRTRTGRILRPKLGLISMEVDAWVSGARDDLHFVPIAIDYEKLIEGGAYAKELAGGEKQKENLKGLLKIPTVLGSRWGSVFLQLDEPLSLAAFAKERGFSREAHEPEARKALVRALAHRIAFGMGRVQTITARSLVAAALLSHRSRGLPARDLEARVELLRKIARSRGARFSPGLVEAPASAQARGPIREAILDFANDGQITAQEAGGETIYQVAEAARSQLSFYKHNAVHHFQDEAVLAGALLSFISMKAPLPELLPRVELLSRILKLELSFRVNVPLSRTVAETAERLAALELVGIGTEGLEVRTGAREQLVFLRELLSDVVESYHIVLTALDGLEGPADRKELTRRSLEKGKALYLAGRVFAAEALSRPTFENALEWLVDQGILQPSGEKTLELAPAFRQPEVRLKLARELERLLQR